MYKAPFSSRFSKFKAAQKHNLRDRNHLLSALEQPCADVQRYHSWLCPSFWSPPLPYHIPFLWAGLTVLVIAPPHMYLSGGFTKTLPTLFLLSLLFSAIPPWLRVLTYFLHTQTQGSSSLSPTETQSPFVFCFCPPSRACSSRSLHSWSTP